MLTILQFMFQDFWHWLGCAILLAIISMWTPISVRCGKKDNGHE